MARREVSRTYRFFVVVLLPLISAVTRRDWRGGGHLPRQGGFIAVANHLSDADPIVVGHFLYAHGAPPHFLAKSSLFEIPVFGRLLRSARQIPVYRGTARAGESLVAAESALAQGRCVMMYPEGTLTRDPGFWPMTGRPGVARLALRTGAPVIPLAQWGAQGLLPRYRILPRPLPRKPVTVVAGEAVDLSDLRGREAEPGAVRDATERIMAAVTRQLAEIRGETPPERAYDLRRDGDPVLELDSWAGRRARARQGGVERRRRFRRS